MSEITSNTTPSEPLTGASTKPACHAKSHANRWTVYWLIILIVTIVSTARLISAIPMKSANDRSRWCTVWSLVERGTYQIDEIRQKPGWDTIDRVRHEGHYYSSKPSLLPTIMAGLYHLEKKLVGWDLLKHKSSTSQLLLFIINILPMAVCLFLFADLVERYAEKPATKFLLVFVAAFSTLATPFLVTFANHTIAVFSVYISLYCLLRIYNRDCSNTMRETILFAACGFFAAMTCCNELPAALFSVIIFLTLHMMDAKRTWLVFVPAALVPLIGFFVTTYISTGDIYPFYVYYGTEKYVHIVNGIPSHWYNPQGVDASTESFPTYFFHCTIGHHGILSLTPIYLLTLWAWMQIRWKQKSNLYPVQWMGVLLTVVILAFYMTRTSNYNYGGGSVGLRWMIWLIPFWLIAMIPLLDRFISLKPFRILVGVLILFSTYSAWSPMSSPWNQTWIQKLIKMDYRIPPPKLDHPLSTWLTDLPDEQTKDNDYWVEFGGTDSSGKNIHLKISDEGTADIRGQKVRKIRFAQQTDSRVDFDTVVSVVPQAFLEGKKMANVIAWATPPSEEEQQKIETLLRGMPKYRRYKESRDRFIITPLRDAALTCQRAASAVGVKNHMTNTEYRYRSDVWLSDEIPFGTAKWKVEITNNKTKEKLGGQTLTVIQAGKIRDSSRSYHQKEQKQKE